MKKPDNAEWVRALLFDRLVVSRNFPKPRVPHGCMSFDKQSIKYPDYCKPNQSTPCHPSAGGKCPDDIEQGRDSQCKRQNIIPTYG